MNKLIILLVALFTSQAQALTNLEQTQRIDKLFEQWQDNNIPGLAIKVSRKNKTEYERYFGLSNLAQKTKIGKTTTFQIASVSKQFTAFAIALLASEKKLELGEEIAQYLPELHKYKHPITVLDLVHHTSGLRDLDDMNGMVGTGFSDYNDVNEVYKLISGQKSLNFKPGERHDYSNSGYVLLAKIVEKISGMTFREFMHTRVFTPIGMQNTIVFDDPFEVVNNRAVAYFSRDNKRFNRDNGISAVYGSTGIYTTVADLDKWARNFVKPKVGNSNVFALMRKTGVLDNGDDTNYAFGQELKTMHGHQAIFHGGGTGAYRAYLISRP